MLKSVLLKFLLLKRTTAKSTKIKIMTFSSEFFITWPDVLDRELPAVKNSTTIWTLFNITSSSSVMVGIRAAGLKGPTVGTMLKTGVTFWTPSKDITLTSCSLVTASMPLTICIPLAIMLVKYLETINSTNAQKWGISSHSNFSNFHQIGSIISLSHIVIR